jgi:predicted metal-binding protein
MKSVEVYCQEALKMGADATKVIDPHSVITAEWVRVKCQYGCPGFGTSLCCPPHSPTPDITRKVIDSYQKAILLHRRIPKEEKIKPFSEAIVNKNSLYSSTHVEGEKTKPFSEVTVNLEIKIFLDGYYRAWSMGSGPCFLCKKCDLTTSCKHGFKARPSMEACGIDVFKTARDNWFPIEVVRTRDEEKNIFGLVLVE